MTTAVPLDWFKRVVDVPDYPKPGIIFKDITPLLADPAAFGAVIDLFAAAARPLAPTQIVAIESRGFIFGGALARALDVGLTIVRKPGKLPRPTRRDVSKVLYFVDTYANHHDPQLAEALVAVLEHNAVAVYVHPGQQSSGMPMISLGALTQARELATHNVALLAEAVRQGYHIVATEPAAALALTHEYPALLDDDDSRLVAANTSEACTYLWRLHQSGELQLDLEPINAILGYHQPCHVKALQAGAPGENLLRLIPGLVVERTENSCSGMAGTVGLKRENYRASLRAGRALIGSLRSPRLQAGTTECSACKIQMEQGAGKPTIHPVKLLALAYGLMPEVSELLSAPVEELVVT